MDELDLARRAVRRNILSEEQLREAQSFASGGRSLLSVLLDLGYLRPQDVSDLTQLNPPSPPGRSGWGMFAVILLTILITSITTKECSRTERMETWMRPQSPSVIHEVRPIGPVLLTKAQEILASAEEQVKRTGGNLDAAMEKKIRHAAELLEEAAAQDADVYLTFLSLGRAHELLDHWELAAEAYRKALAQDERDAPANLGLARVLLLLDRPLQAHAHASRACRGLTEAEAYLVRAKANMNLGNRREAREDLDLALQRDAGLRSAVRALQQRLDE